MASFRVLSNGVAWQPWSRAAFARAHAERKPVLLSISATWCGSCHEMDRTSYADPAIATLINERFVPIRVDADERPDIGERYNLGGWPTTAFLTPEGQILAGGTFVSADRMPGVLAQVADAFASHSFKSRRTPPLQRRAPSIVLPGDVVSDTELSARVFATFDGLHGGFGIEPKFPLTAPLHLALELWTTTRDSTAESVRRRDTRRDGMECALRRDRRRVLSIRDHARLADAPLREASRRECGVDAHVSRGRRGARDRALYRARRRYAALHPDLAGRSGGRRLARIAAGRSSLLRRRNCRCPARCSGSSGHARRCTPTPMP